MSAAPAEPSPAIALIQFMSQNFTGESHDQNYQPPLQHEITLNEVITREEAFLNRPLTPYEREEVVQRVDYWKLHHGHETQHMEMFLIFIFAFIISKVIITLWKRNHAKSYNITTLVGLWIIPFLLAVYNGRSIRFEIIWTIFSLVNAYIVRIALQTPMKSLTPRLIFFNY
jgi:RING finger protein 121